MRLNRRALGLSLLTLGTAGIIAGAVPSYRLKVVAQVLLEPKASPPDADRTTFGAPPAPWAARLVAAA